MREIEAALRLAYILNDHVYSNADQRCEADIGGRFTEGRLDRPPDSRSEKRHADFRRSEGCADTDARSPSHAAHADTDANGKNIQPK